MNIIRISTGTDEQRTRAIAELLDERYNIDRVEIERREIDGYLDDLVLAAVTNLPINAATKLKTDIQFVVNVYRIAYDRGYENGKEAAEDQA
jgi:flavodoxin